MRWRWAHRPTMTFHLRYYLIAEAYSLPLMIQCACFCISFIDYWPGAGLSPWPAPQMLLHAFSRKPRRHQHATARHATPRPPPTIAPASSRGAVVILLLLMYYIDDIAASYLCRDAVISVSFRITPPPCHDKFPLGQSPPIDG